MRKSKPTIYIFSHNVEPGGISGGETILIETFKRIGKYFSSVRIYTWKPGKDLYTKYGLTNVTYKLSGLPVLANFYLSFFLRTFYGLWLGIRLRLSNPTATYLYFSSDFWPDAIPVILLKIRYPRTIFVSNFFLAAPNPFFGFQEKGKLKLPTLNGIFFYLMQQPVYFFSKHFADFIFLTSQPDVKRFPRLETLRKYLVVKGGVNIADIKKYLKYHKHEKKIYDGVFMGRFHPQKGVLELLDIWKLVVAKKKNAQLLLIGDGPLVQQVQGKIRKNNLEENITPVGYVFDNNRRYQLFNKSRIVLHPALYDSGGMSAAEAMAFGLPGVSFDLDALKTYYPQGMIKVKKADIKGFAKVILQLLENKKLYLKIQKEAKNLVEGEWNWDKRAEEIAQKILYL